MKPETETNLIDSPALKVILPTSIIRYAQHCSSATSVGKIIMVLAKGTGICKLTEVELYVLGECLDEIHIAKNKRENARIRKQKSRANKKESK